LLGVREHGVDVAEVAERRAVGALASAVRTQAREQVGPLLLGAQQLALKAGGAQVLGQVLLGRALVARRVDGVEADQLAQELLRLHGHIGGRRGGAHAALGSAIIAQIVRRSLRPPRGSAESGRRRACLSPCPRAAAPGPSRAPVPWGSAGGSGTPRAG